MLFCSAGKSVESPDGNTDVRERYYNPAEHFPEKVDALLNALDRVSEAERCQTVEHPSLSFIDSRQSTSRITEDRFLNAPMLRLLLNSSYSIP